MKTICNGKMNQNGFCEKCYQVSQTTSGYCTRLIDAEVKPVTPTEYPIIDDDCDNEFCDKCVFRINYNKFRKARYAYENATIKNRTDNDIEFWANEVNIIKELNDPDITTEDDLAPFDWLVFGAKAMRDGKIIEYKTTTDN